MQKIALPGGDQRQIFLADALRRRGFRIMGFGNLAEPAGKTLAETLDGAKIVVLPVPATRDGENLSQSAKETPPIRFGEVLNFLAPGAFLLGGALPREWIAAAEARGIRSADYYKSERTQLLNALPTAEGALRLAMQALPTTLFGTQTVVVGYGRIASLLSEKLVALGAKVGVLARSPEALARAELHGANPYALGQGVPPFLADCRVLFNTVPERVLDRSFLQALPQNCILIELASLPGGFDADLAKRAGFQVIPAQGLPGRFYPETAGKILADAVCAILNANGFLD